MLHYNRRTVKLWSVQTSVCLGTMDHSAPLTSLQLSHFLLATACCDGGVYLWSISLPPSSPLMQWAVEAGVNFSSLTVDESRLFASGRSVDHSWLSLETSGFQFELV